ncbi:SAM-dependent methyltransferase [Vibrio ishigakensis]|uniref:SAM-dependent methyltransferase n=1 Tax=Vibrio ishigakensis TaxID=1481914 RepID=A0A0B8QCH8_9VIBR|nr:SAM-dependent methyltransferase [Vibrio ishigakensis]
MASQERQSELSELAERWGLKHDPESVFALVLEDKLELKKLDEPKLGSIFVDFAGGAVAHRRKFGGGKGQAIAKAAGLNKGVTPNVLDGTAGLGVMLLFSLLLGARCRWWSATLWLPLFLMMVLSAPSPTLRLVLG